MNRIVVFSETSKRWIAPQYDEFRVVTGPLRKREGDIAIIKVGMDRFLNQAREVRVMVERSSNGHWWLVECN